jgi:hypothetical protein
MFIRFIPIKISDFKESQWYSDRDEVFCNTNSSPYVCAYPDPTTKDIYVEIDWMKNPSTNEVFKPTTTQLGIVETMFANEGINFHADLGEYGGGKELEGYNEYLPNYQVSNVADYFDFELGLNGYDQSFATNRQGIWHYMIYGDHYADSDGDSPSSGWSAVMGTEIFISGGVAANISWPGNTDRAVAGTIAHEIGHTLCLNRVHVYVEQGTDCVYAGIDNRSGQAPTNNPDSFYNLANYTSVMNYRYQLTQPSDLGYVDYSHGTNTTNDHDDWSAVKSHIGGFASPKTIYIEFGSAANRKKYPRTPSGRIIAESHTSIPEPRSRKANH